MACLAWDWRPTKTTGGTEAQEARDGRWQQRNTDGSKVTVQTPPGGGLDARDTPASLVPETRYTGPQSWPKRRTTRRKGQQRSGRRRAVHGQFVRAYLVVHVGGLIYDVLVCSMRRQDGIRQTGTGNWRCAIVLPQRRRKSLALREECGRRLARCYTVFLFFFLEHVRLRRGLGSSCRKGAESFYENDRGSSRREVEDEGGGERRKKKAKKAKQAKKAKNPRP